jgi:hypothetical protein
MYDTQLIRMACETPYHSNIPAQGHYCHVCTIKHEESKSHTYQRELEQALRVS